MRLFQYIEKKLRIIAQLTAMLLMIEFVLIAILEQYYDPTWWSDGKPDDLNFYSSLMRSSGMALLIYAWLIAAIYFVKRRFIIRIGVSFFLIPPILITSFLIMPIYIMAFENVLYLLPAVTGPLVFGLLMQILQLHAMLWGEGWSSEREPVAAAHAAITLTYVFLSELMFFGLVTR